MTSKLLYLLALFFGKSILLILQLFGRTGTALPGRVALLLYPDLLREIRKRCGRRILITGTNGKTTTNNLVWTMLNRPGTAILSNLRGSNMKQGVASAFLADTRGHYDWGLFESDERAFPGMARDLEPDFILVTNFFRDQLDRYGEIETTVGYVRNALESLESTVVLNGDDPFTAGLGIGRKNCIYYGVRPEKTSSVTGHTAETLFCPVCGKRLSYEAVHYGQLGRYQCPSCGNRNPVLDFRLENIRSEKSRFMFDVWSPSVTVREVVFKYPGFYNLYNCVASWSLGKAVGLNDAALRSAVEGFDYRLGRMEDMTVRGRSVRLTLVKNPVGFSEVLKDIADDSGTKAVLLVLNDNDNDGRDVSWIWDADLEIMPRMEGLRAVYCSGRRFGDMAVRLKYAGLDRTLLKSADRNITRTLEEILMEEVDRIYVLPTYSALYYIQGWLAQA